MRKDRSGYTPINFIIWNSKRLKNKLNN
jgi:hypothetical protein